MRRYRLVVEGQVDARFATAFEGMTMTYGEATTVLEGPVRDQAELQGLLQHLAGLGANLVSVAPIEAGPTGSAGPS